MEKNNERKFWSTKKKILFVGLVFFIIVYVGIILWHTYKPLPEGVSYAGDMHWTDDIELFTDLSYAQNKKGDGMKHELTIFPELYKMIEEAEEFIVLDIFMLDHYYDEDIDFPKIAQELTATLVKKKEENPDMPIYFITDPLNKGYGSYESKWFSKMEEAGIEVVYTNLDVLRDSTPIYSGLYRMIFRWTDFGGKGWIPNAMSAKAPKMRLASYMTLLNVKANHRKTIVTEKAAFVTSGNPHNASGFHGNVALKVKSGSVINDILESEEAVLRLTKKGKLPRVTSNDPVGGDYAVQYVTEKKILDSLLGDIAIAQPGDTIRMGMFYIAEMSIVDALIDAANRGVDIEMILDPNENAFGSEKSGIPNRPVAQELVDKTDGKIKIRWYNTVVGQYHTKLVVIKAADQTYISNGSANLTERTLDNYNLEANLRVIAPNDSKLVGEIDDYFKRLWENEDALYTLDFDEFQDSFTFFQRGIYKMQELFKLTTY